MTVDILGAEYEIIKKTRKDDPDLEGLSGYCNGHLKSIVIGDLTTYDSYKNDTPEFIQREEKSTLRHEIVHAFFFESGLVSSTLQYGGGWARNEEMIDWFAIQGPKIYAAWQAAGAI